MATYRSVVGRARRFAEQKDQSTEGVVDGGTKSAAIEGEDGHSLGLAETAAAARREDEVGHHEMRLRHRRSRLRRRRTAEFKQTGRYRMISA